MTRPKDSKIERTCPVCGGAFLTTPKRIREGAGKHCSKACANAALRGDPIARFWEQVDRSGGEDACWPWTGNVVQGVGSIRVGPKTWRTNRLAWTLAYGELPKRQQVRPTCGDPLCCNPKHLESFGQDDPERFWSLADRTGGIDACWFWQGDRNRHGYGLFYVRGKTVTAHRHAWRIANGEPPADLCVCHACDVRECVNPAHLWLGTSEENTADRHAKGRSLPPRNPRRTLGEAAWNAKLTAADVRSIRAEFGAGIATRGELARRYGITPENVDSVVQRKTWKHV